MEADFRIDSIFMDEELGEMFAKCYDNVYGEEFEKFLGSPDTEEGRQNALTILEDGTYTMTDELRNEFISTFGLEDFDKEIIEVEEEDDFYDDSEDEVVETFSIREALNQIDLNTYNKYDLLNLYEACNLNEKEKRELGKLLYDKEDANVIYDTLNKRYVSGEEIGMSERVKDDMIPEYDDDLDESKSINEAWEEIKDWEDTDNYDVEAEYNQALKEVSDQLDNYGEEEAAEYLYMNNHISRHYKDKIAKELGIESEYRKWTTPESKSIKEDVTRDFTLNKTNYSDAEHYEGYVIARRADNELKCDIFQIVNGKPELKCGDGVPDAFCRMLIDGWNKEFFDSEAMDRLFPIESKSINEGNYDDYQAQYDDLYNDAVAEDESNKELFNQVKSELITNYSDFVNKYKKYGVWDFKNKYSNSLNDELFGGDRFLRDATRYTPHDYIDMLTKFEYDGSNYPFNVFNMFDNHICFYGCYAPTSDNPTKHFSKSVQDVYNLVPDWNEYRTDALKIQKLEKELQYISGHGPESVNTHLRKSDERGPSKDKYNAIYDVFGKYLEKAYQDTFKILKSNGYTANKVRTNSSARVKGTPSFGFTVRNIDDEQIQSIKDILASEGIEIYDTTIYKDNKGPKMSTNDPSKYREVLFGVWMPDLANKDKRPFKNESKSITEKHIDASDVNGWTQSFPDEKFSSIGEYKGYTYGKLISPKDVSGWYLIDGPDNIVIGNLSDNTYGSKQELISALRTEIHRLSLDESKSIKESYNGILTDEEQELLWDIADRYVTSYPISGSWENETEHELEAISDELNVSKEDAKKIMIDYLGFSEEQFNEG